jgi:RimJ/RimL family protein N-acetyltransferase
VRARWGEELADRGTHVYVWVDDGGAVVGFAATRDDQLLHFGTAVRTWGTGTATRFHDAVLLELVRTAPPDSDHIRLRVFEANMRARRFYEKLGWRRTELWSRSSFPPHAVLLEYRRSRPSPT